MLSKRFIKVVFISLMVIALDQFTKYYVLEMFTRQALRVIEVNIIFNLVLVWNYGISFGAFNEASQSQTVLILISLAIIATLIMWLIKSGDKKSVVPIALIIGGAIGNIIDRILYGAVIDFLDFHFRHYHYPAFNVADSCIVIGALILMLQMVQEEKVNKK